MDAFGIKWGTSTLGFKAPGVTAIGTVAIIMETTKKGAQPSLEELKMRMEQHQLAS